VGTGSREENASKRKSLLSELNPPSLAEAVNAKGFTGAAGGAIR
jgi:hypothetical protein